MTKVVLFVASFALLILSAACVSRPTPLPATITPAALTTLLPASPDSPSATPNPSPRPAATLTPTAAAPEASNFVEDCMAGCHLPEPTEYYAAGAMPKPADHVGRTTCLECHGKPDAAKPLPATHIGRMDPSCNTCHQ